jgi:Flp pilus assembly protein TadD
MLSGDVVQMHSAVFMRKEHLIVLVLALLSVGAFWPVLDSQFISIDDNIYITENDHIQAGLTWKNVVWAFTSTETSFYWHPLTLLSHMLDIEIFGLNPHGHHFTNLLLHIANATLLFLLLRQITGAMWQSAVVAALFAIHPLHVESVAWVSERKDVLSTLCGLLCIWAYYRYLGKPGIARYLLVVVCFMSALMAKPMMVTLPFLLLLLDYWPFASITRTDSKTGMRVLDYDLVARRVGEKIPLFLLVAVCSVVTYYAQKQSGCVCTLQDMPIDERATNALRSYGMYIYHMLVPTNLAFLYPLTKVQFGMGQMVWAAAFLFAIPGIVLLLHKRYPYLFVGWFWYVGILVPVIGLVQTGTQAMADRYTYVSLIGLFIAITWGIGDLLRNVRCRNTLLVSLAIVIIALLTILTRLQAAVWHNNFSLYQHALKVIKDSEIINNYMAVELMFQHRYAEAAYYLREVLRITPNWQEVHYNLGNLAAYQKDFAQAIIHYRHAIHLDPAFAKAHNNLGICFAKQKEMNKAIASYQQAIYLKPAYAEAHYNLGNTYLELGQYDKAVAAYTRAISISPRFSVAHHNLGLAHLYLARPTAAIDAFKQAVASRPDYAEAYHALGNAYEQICAFEEAVHYYRQALKLKPDYTSADDSLQRVTELLGNKH